MARKISRLLCVLFIFSGFQLVEAQTETSVDALKSGTIDSQFEYIYQNSNNFQEYKVVKKSNLDQLKSNLLDSMKVMRAEVAAQKALIQSKNDSISRLNTILKATETEKQDAIEAKDNFAFLGMSIPMSAYSSMMWILVAILAAALGFFSFQYMRSFKRIRKAKYDLEEVQEEFDNHRKNTLERERKLKRELIDAQMRK